MSHAFSTTPRVRLTVQQRARLFLDRGGACEVWHVDHKIALENGGTNDLINLRIVCRNCHGDKTRSDHGAAARSREKAVAQVVPGRYRRGSSRFRRPPGTVYDWQQGRYRREGPP